MENLAINIQTLPTSCSILVITHLLNLTAAQTQLKTHSSIPNISKLTQFAKMRFSTVTYAATIAVGNALSVQTLPITTVAADLTKIASDIANVPFGLLV